SPQSGRLREWITDAAWIQAQRIARVQNIGWNARLAEGIGRFHPSQEAFAAYRKTIEKPVQRGQIRVHVSSTRIHQWKEERQQHQAGKGRELEGKPCHRCAPPTGADIERAEVMRCRHRKRR